jgi:hypothetical protein
MKKKLTIAEKLNEPTPKAIKKLQKNARFIGGILTIASGLLASTPQIQVSFWVPLGIAFATAVNELYLQTFTAEDNE